MSCDERGERVVLVHASPFVSWYRPLVERLTGFSTCATGAASALGGGGYRPLTAAEDAATCARLMAHVGWPSAHIVGHSYGALVALQLAIDSPERVGSVALLEPAARGISSSEQVAAALEPVIAAYRSGDTAAAVDGFLRHVCGDGYRAVLDRAVPGASPRRSPRPTCSSRRRWRPCSSGASGPTKPGVSRSRCSTWSEPRAPRGSSKEQTRAVLVPAPSASRARSRPPADGAEPDRSAHGLNDFFTRHRINHNSEHDSSAR